MTDRPLRRLRRSPENGAWIASPRTATPSLADAIAPSVDAILGAPPRDDAIKSALQAQALGRELPETLPPGHPRRSGRDQAVEDLHRRQVTELHQARQAAAAAAEEKQPRFDWSAHGEDLSALFGGDDDEPTLDELVAEEDELEEHRLPGGYTYRGSWD